MKAWHWIVIAIFAVLLLGAWTVPLFDGKTFVEWLQDKLTQG